MKTNNSILVTAPEIAKDLGISTTSAYKLIHKWNAELEAKNYTTISGKVSRRYYYERIYGMNYAGFDIHFKVNHNDLFVTEIIPSHEIQ